MMRFREIRTSEKITDKVETNQNYKKIKSQNELSIEELNQIVNNIFEQFGNE